MRSCRHVMLLAGYAGSGKQDGGIREDSAVVLAEPIQAIREMRAMVFDQTASILVKESVNAARPGNAARKTRIG